MSSSFTFPTENNEGFKSGPPTAWIVFVVFTSLCVVGVFIGVCCCCGHRQRRHQVSVETQLPDGSTVYVNVEDVQSSLNYHQHHNALMDHHSHHQHHMDHHSHHHTAHMAAVNNSVIASTI